MGKLIVIEGTDGSGKQTQTELLYEKMLQNEKKIKKISFPNYESPSSTLVKMYLHGDFGNDANSVNPYAASTFYAVDRYASYKMKWEEFYSNGGIILSDRYTTANMVHQASKIDDIIERKKYLDWLIDFEWYKMKIPKPDIVFFLDVPFEYSQKLMHDRENKINGSNDKDIHERDKEYLKKSYENSKEIAKDYGWKIIECIKNDKMRTIEDINNEIYEIVMEEIEK